jgi:hypothetical protein
MPSTTPGSLGYVPQIPPIAPRIPRPPLGFTPATAPTFTGQAPTAPNLPSFAEPDPNQVASDPYYQFRQAEGMKAMQRGAASRGTLLTGGFQKALTGWNQGLASEEAQNAYTRARDTYTTNRDTAALGFNQGLQSFQGSLAGFNANTGAAENTRNYNLAGSTAADARMQSNDDAERQYAQELLDREAAQQNNVLASQQALRQSIATPPPAPFVSPTPAWAERTSQPTMMQGTLAQPNMGGGSMDQERQRQEVADEFARQVAAAREQNAYTNRPRPMRRDPNAVIRPGMAG